jgi:MerR family copper efflux transcriptional regulator
MLIAQFSALTGLPRDTVRFYVRLGLLEPRTSAVGGRHPYMQFTEADANAAVAIRIGQALGMSLKQIGRLLDERRGGRLRRPQRLALMKAQLLELDAKADELARLQRYVRAKIKWQEAGESGPAPRLEFVASGPRRPR